MSESTHAIDDVVAALTRTENRTEEPTLFAPTDALVLHSIEVVSDAVQKLAPPVEVRSDETVLQAIDDVARQVPPELELGAPVKHHVNALLPSIKRQYDENLHSDFLAALLTPSKVGRVAVDLFHFLFTTGNARPAVALPECPRVLIASREVRLDAMYHNCSGLAVGRRRIDVVARTGRHVLVLENKVWTLESEGQTRDYALTARAAYPDESYDRACVLLSPHGERGVHPDFKGLSYGRLYRFLVSLLDRVDSSQGSRPLLEAYCAELAIAFVLPSHAAHAQWEN